MQAHDGMWFTFLCVSDLLFVMVTLVEAAGLTLLMCHFDQGFRDPCFDPSIN